MKLPVIYGMGGATYLRNIVDTVQTVQYSESQCMYSTHSKNIGMSVDVTVGCMQGSAPRPLTRFVFYEQENHSSYSFLKSMYLYKP